MVKVCAVIVLYNDSDEFDKCLQSLERQSRKIDYYIFVDNSNEEISRKNKKIISDKKFANERFIYIKFKENKGSAFGFAFGMWIAFQKKYELIWLNDQDGIADKYCIENILNQYEKYNQDIGIYIPNVCDVQTLKELSGFHVHSNKFLHGGIADERKINSFGTTGACITYSTIEKIGYYNYKVCYVGNEDKEYALRLRKNKLQIKYIKEAIYYHPDAYQKYQIKRKKRKYYFLEYIIPLNMGLIKKNQKNNLRFQKVCESSSYMNYKYADIFHRNVNLLYSIIRMLLCKNCNYYETLKAYRRGRLLAYEMDEKIFEDAVLRKYFDEK
ncbi:MAG: glycosyltransferase [Clostridiales bacterium]|nr:glycosyltransferase [Clostridiales bacterium]